MVDKTRFCVLIFSSIFLFRTKNGPVFQTEMIHNCLFTLKTTIASLQKCEIDSVALDKDLLKELTETSCNIIEDETFLIECRNAAAMVLPGILLHYPLSIMPYFSKLFSSEQHDCDNGIENLVLKASTKYINNMEKLSCIVVMLHGCLLYTSPSPRDKRQSRMPSSA